MVDKAISATRQLAKRQMTWLRSEPDALWLADPTGDWVAQTVKKLMHSEGL
jgi:tRNA dimethylallyltransferase